MASRRKLIWVRCASQAIALTAANDAEAFDPIQQFRGDMGITRNLPGTTVTRSRISVFATGATAGAVPVWIGMRKTSFPEITQINSDPLYAIDVGPDRDETNDWMLWDAMYPNHGADATTGQPNAITYEYDVKSQRKLDEAGDTLGIFVSKPTSTGTLTVYVSTSILLMLS